MYPKINRVKEHKKLKTDATIQPKLFVTFTIISCPMYSVLLVEQATSL